MKKFTFLLIACLFASTTIVSAIEILDVPPGNGTLNDAIRQYKGERIYRLQNGYNGYYVLNEIINNTDFELTIIGGGTPDADDPKPDMPPTLQTSGTGGVPFPHMFNVNDNLTLEGIYFINATADNVYNSEFFLQINSNNTRVKIDNCILDPSGNPVLCNGGGVKLYITNSLFNRLTHQNLSVNGPVNFFFPNATQGADTLYIENNTFIGLSTAVFSDNFNPLMTNFTWINHNTFIHHLAQMDWMGNQKDYFFTNNLLYDCHVIPYDMSWVGGGWDLYPAGAVAELLYSYPSSTVKNLNGEEVDFGFEHMTSYVGYNIEFKNPAFYKNLDDLYEWTTAEGRDNKFIFQPLVWGDDVPERTGIERSYALANNPQYKIYNNEGYKWKALENNYVIDPQFTDTRIKEKSDIFARWALPATKKDYFAVEPTIDLTSLNWYWDPDGEAGKNETWPLFDGSYTNQQALTHSIESYPAGDLNWFPEIKAKWENAQDKIAEHILALKTDRIDVAALSIANATVERANLIYPNPAKDSFRVNGNIDNTISIYSISGKLVKRIAPTQDEISVSGMDKGIYMVQFISEGTPVVNKLIIE